jgi:hypothetical protein
MKMVNSVMPDNNTDSIVCLQDYANNGIDYVINIIRTYFPSAPGSLQVVIYFFYSLVVIIFDYVVCSPLLTCYCRMCQLCMVWIWYHLLSIVFVDDSKDLKEIEELVSVLTFSTFSFNYKNHFVCIFKIWKQQSSGNGEKWHFCY